jgi:hypothetical protein
MPPPSTGGPPGGCPAPGGVSTLDFPGFFHAGERATAGRDAAGIQFVPREAGEALGIVEHLGEEVPVGLVALEFDHAQPAFAVYRQEVGLLAPSQIHLGCDDGSLEPEVLEVLLRPNVQILLPLDYIIPVPEEILNFSRHKPPVANPVAGLPPWEAAAERIRRAISRG